MTRALMVLIVSIIGTGCQNPAAIEIQSILGEYYSPKKSEDYSHLDLREDKTFHFDQAKSHSCNVWGHFYGNWEINGNRLVLFEGINLDSLIEVSTNRNLEADTLVIFFSDKFMNEFPDLKVRIGLDSIDTEIKNNRIVFDKHSFFTKKEKTSYLKTDKASTYKYYPLELSIRSTNYYHISSYILNKDEIRFGLGTFTPINTGKRKLIEYKLGNGMLTSMRTSNWINQHELEREMLEEEKQK